MILDTSSAARSLRRATDERLLETETSVSDRERIVDVGERLIRHFGHRKTTVADIASDLRTSRASLYRFFPTKDAIDQDVCARVVDRALEAVRVVATGEETAAARLAALVEQLHRQTVVRAKDEPHLHQLFVKAIEQDWGVATRYFAEATRLIEIVVRKGLNDGDFDVSDPVEAARCFAMSIIPFIHPGFVHQVILKHRDMSSARDAQVQFLIASLRGRH